MRRSYCGNHMRRRADAKTSVSRPRSLNYERVANWQQCADLESSHTGLLYPNVIMIPNDVLHLPFKLFYTTFEHTMY